MQRELGRLQLELQSLLQRYQEQRGMLAHAQEEVRWPNKFLRENIAGQTSTNVLAPGDIAHGLC